ncbi:hypothetical protein C8F04DRAFT_1192137 [Mycena alexandri]|uniref:Uncharacterized protein n=1 Tax=Mycena alexandri TaxID=1745969 RepID=A0AAD6WXE6_9AGAR|nr:hypothetical protein C8F04DRAFT_1192137 [Mycena alexandri]
MDNYRVCTYLLIEPRKASEHVVQDVPLVELPLSAADIAAACGNVTAAAKSLCPTTETIVNLSRSALRFSTFVASTLRKIRTGSSSTCLKVSMTVRPSPPVKSNQDSKLKVHTEFQLKLNPNLGPFSLLKIPDPENSIVDSPAKFQSGNLSKSLKQMNRILAIYVEITTRRIIESARQLKSVGFSYVLSQLPANPPLTHRAGF